MADVYLGAAAGPAGFNKLVVIKRLRSGTAEDPALVEMFLDEARLAARLNHPNIVHTYEVEESPEGYLLVMEYLEGQSLRRLAKAVRAHEGRFEPILAAHLMGEVLEGLHYVHEMRDYDGSPLGIVHRDVSPQNIFVTYDGTVKVLDFGIAKGALNVTDTQSGVLKGKVSYMAPEQVGGEALDKRADIFSAGVVLWELLTGEKLFKGDMMEALRSVMSSSIPAPSTLARDVPYELDHVVLKALARAPEDRYETALAMNKALSDIVRRSGFVLRREDVASRMQEFFGEARETMARTVQMYMASRVSEPGTQSEILPLSVRPAASDPLGPASGVRTMSPSLAAAPARRPWVPFAGGLAALALVAGSAFYMARTRTTSKHESSRAAAVEDPAQKPRENAPAQTPRAETEQVCHLTLSSDPLEAQVEWGGNVIGQTPMLIDLLPGPQTFVLSRDGYFKATVVLNITDSMSGKSESRTIVMIPRKGKAGLAARTAPQLKGALANAVAAGGAGDAPIAANPGLPADPNIAPSEPTPNSPLAKSTPPSGFAAIDNPPIPAAPSAAAAPALGAAAAPSVPAVLSFGPEMTRPSLISGGELSYPREAMLAGVSGTIIAKCLVTSEGALRNCRIIKGLPFLDKAALDVLATRKYSPVTYQGKAVSVEYVFNLKVAPPAPR